MLNGTSDPNSPHAIIASLGTFPKLRNAESQLFRLRDRDAQIRAEIGTLHRQRSDWNEGTTEARIRTLDAERRQIDRELNGDLRSIVKQLRLARAEQAFNKLSPFLNEKATKANQLLTETLELIDWLNAADAELQKINAPDELRLYRTPRDLASLTERLERIARRTNGLQGIAPPTPPTQPQSATRAVL